MPCVVIKKFSIYNSIMDCKIVPLKELWVRILPTFEKDYTHFDINPQDKAILIKRLETQRPPIKPDNLFFKFKVDGIFRNVSQEKIFNKIITQDLLNKLLSGMDLIILAFGCYGTGKSHTITGNESKSEYRGIIPRLLEKLLKVSDKYSPRRKLKISITYIEIIGNDIYDLLQKGKPKVHYHASSVPVDNLRGSLGFISGGSSRRSKNKDSHYGTAVLTIHMKYSYRSFNRPVFNQSKIHIVEMAGNGGTREASDTLMFHKEGNLSKSNLRTIYSWADKIFDETVPGWRSSKLAYYLGESYRNGYFRFLGHIKITDDAVLSTTSTLHFAHSLMRYPKALMVPAMQTGIDKDEHIKELEIDIGDAKEKLTLKQIMNGLYHSKFSSKLDESRSKICAKQYLNDELSETQVLNDFNSVLYLNVFRKIYTKEINELSFKSQDLSEETADIIKNAKKKFLGSPDSRSLSSVSLMSSKSICKKRKTKKKNVFEDGLPTVVIDTVEIPEVNTNVQGDEEYENVNNEKKGLENYSLLFDEFINQNQHMKPRLCALKENVNEHFRVRSMCIDQTKTLKSKLDILLEESKIPANLYNEEKHEQLQRKIDMLREKFKESHSKLLSTHQKYKESQEALNKYLWDLETACNTYIMKIYSTSLAFPLFNEEESK